MIRFSSTNSKLLRNVSLWLLMCCTTLLPSTRIGAQEPDSAADQAEDSASNEPRPGALVLRNGSVMQGMISRLENLYEVQGDYGTVQVPSEFVKLRAESISAAYNQLNNQATARQSASSHVTLAKWCVANNLDGEAKQQIKAALALDPGLQEAQRMLQTLSIIKTPSEDAPSTPRQAEMSPAAGSSAVKTDNEALPISRLSPRLTVHFVRRVQPLLVKTCATAGCHTRESDLGFQLIHVIPGKSTTRVASDKNLAAILERVDRNRPLNSRLLTVLRDNHGGSTKKLFSGPRGNRQLADLQEWIREVAEEDAIPERASPAKLNGERLAVGETTRGSDPTSVNRRDPFAGKPITPAAPFQKQNRAGGDNSDYDPFDPSGFNRQTQNERKSR